MAHTVTLKVRLGDGEHVNPSLHLFGGGEKTRHGSRSCGGEHRRETRMNRGD